MRRLHFLECDENNIGGPSAPYAVLPIPYERSTSFGKGTALAPSAILQASQQIELFDDELLKPLNLNVQTLEEPNMEAESEQEALNSIRRAATDAVAGRKRFLMGLGGEHTITAPLVEASIAEHGDLSVLHLDAHLDLRDSYNGNRMSHACVMRRVMEMGAPITHVGIRSLCKEEYDLVMSRGIRIFWARSLVAPADDSWIDEIIKDLTPSVYITIDIDCFDPSEVPGTGTPEPGGLSWRQVIGLLRKTCASRKVVSADIVEVMPTPGAVVSEYTAARLAAKLMMYHKNKTT